MSPEKTAQVAKIVDVVTRLAVGLALAGILWIASSVSDLSRQYAVLDQKVSTIADRMEGLDDFRSRLALCESMGRQQQRDIAKLAAWLDWWQKTVPVLDARQDAAIEAMRRDMQGLPPDWLKERVKALEDAVEALKGGK